MFYILIFPIFKTNPVPSHQTGHLHSDPALQSAFTEGITGHGHNRFKPRLLRQCPSFRKRLNTHRTGAFRISDRRQPKISVNMLLTYMFSMATVVSSGIVRSSDSSVHRRGGN